jgi:hypothetical protein
LSARRIPAGLIVRFAAHGCGRAAGLPGHVNPYLTEIAAIVVVLIAGLWTARAEVDDDRTGTASTAVGRRFARRALGATAEAAPLIARCGSRREFDLSQSATHAHGHRAYAPRYSHRAP